MAVQIQPNQIQNPQQIEAVVAGPDDANRLFIIDGQFDSFLTAFSQGTNFLSQKETFTVLIGPVLTHKQFIKANATASLTKTSFNTNAVAPGEQLAFMWNILGVDVGGRGIIKK
jgi:hypothetical protein